MILEAFVYQLVPPPSPTNAWTAEVRTENTRHTVSAATRELAQEFLEQELGPMIRVTWRFEAPPRPKRPGDPKPAASAAAVENDAIPYTKLAQRFHPDLAGSKRRYSATQVMQIINELRDSARAKA